MKRRLVLVAYMGLLAALGALAGYLLQLRNEASGAPCRERGGYWYCAGRAPCVCLAKGSVLP